ncbi:MAG: glycosyltransferase family 4 protein [Colwellia sp.]|nr:glycosyltransferase family 4 protein [Colwellia sp.]
MNEYAGALDGVSIIRFVHVSGQGGGVEQYLAHLNRMLLMRNRMTILQLFPAIGENDLDEKIEKIGRGEIRLIPLPCFSKSVNDKGVDFWERKSLEKTGFKQLITNMIVYNPTLYRTFFKSYLKNRRRPFRNGEALGADSVVRRYIAQDHIDCVIIHYVTGRDSFDVMRACQEANSPYIIQNHYENSRFRYIAMRELSNGAACVAGVSQKGLPPYLKKRYNNLSDGIDTSFFSFEKASKLHNGPDKKFVILAARIYPDKGHIPLIKALSLLSRKGISVQCVFAGRCHDIGFKEKLYRMIAQHGLQNDIIFLGDLDQQELRDWYAASVLAVLPSMSEGLPRALIEVQSMGKPVVAYDSGGMSESFIHGQTGFLVRKGDVTGLADRLALLLKDEKIRLDMGEKARAFVEQKFSLEALAARHEECYLSVIKGK